MVGTATSKGLNSKGNGCMQDDARTVATEVREVFQRRKDKLQERRSWPLKDTTWEVLAPGARGALKQATLVKGLRRDLLFYHQVCRSAHSVIATVVV